ncbi:aromatic acid exporter family protein [Bacillus sp. WMMC1349]|uniref:FUSC family protein n=1 Tax=Bacillus sp. WMMC1349 TaxID=2736254 RepID=UPI001556D83D|nr:aromatic acid exporter family protein [Bacillus sp. WMMC1349]NPC91917.1 aromatic acid exporter family protein [Bacillus sp. WMMC1349]
MKLGARIFKTGIAITLALYLASWIGLPTPVFAGIAAIFAIQPSIYRSFLTIVDQVQANIIGATIAIIFGLVFGPSPIIIGLTAIIVITINLKLKMENTISIALVTVVAILESSGDNFLIFSLIRTGTVILGVLCSFLVNLVFLPPKYETKLVNLIVENTDEVMKWIRLLTRKTTEHSMLKEDIEKLKEKMTKIDYLYLLYKEERSYFKKSSYVKSRKLVLFRQAIIVSNRALDTLKKLHRLENDFYHMPTEFQETLVEELDFLLHWHERILMRFVGKVKTHDAHEHHEEGMIYRQHLTESFLKSQPTLTEDLLDYNMLMIMASAVEYREQLEHLETLISSFQTYHRQDSELEVDDD